MSKGGDPQKILFVISPIGSEDSSTRTYFDKVRRHVIEPVAKDTGYRTIRSDEIPRPGTITNHIIEHLLNDDLVVADMTERNPNVFYELAVRHAIRKPVILMGPMGERPPFDLAAQRVIMYDLDPDNIEKAKVELRRQITEVNSEKFIVDSPIETAIKFERNGQVTEESQLNEVLSIVRNLSERLSSIEQGRRFTTEVTIPSRPSIRRAIMLSNREASPGEDVKISGIGFTPGSNITIYWDDITLPPLQLIHSQPDGSFSATIQIPKNAEPGIHTLTCLDSYAAVELLTQIKVN